MTRPKRANSDPVVTAIRLPRDLHDRLRETADERATSVTHLVVRAAERFLDNLPPLEPTK
jgi:predicted transcriptional regulator